MLNPPFPDTPTLDRFRAWQTGELKTPQGELLCHCGALARWQVGGLGSLCNRHYLEAFPTQECAECGVLKSTQMLTFSPGAGFLPGRWFCEKCSDE